MHNSEGMILFRPVVLVVAPSHAHFVRFRSGHREVNLRYVSSPGDFLGLSRDTPFVVVGEFSPHASEFQFQLKQRGFKEMLPEAMYDA